jgi:hypothetical protein
LTGRDSTGRLKIECAMVDGARGAEGRNLVETSQKDYRTRTKLNVRDSDGTLVVTPSDELAGGSLLTVRVASELGKPLLHLAVSAGAEEAGERLRLFIDNNRIRVLNVAGCRLSRSAAAADFTLKILDLALY